MRSVSGTTKIDISDELTVTTGAAGEITFYGLVSINAAAAANDGTFGAIMRWQYKPVGGSYSDVGGADIADDSPVEVGQYGGSYWAIPGQIDAAASITGLSASTDYVIKLQAARDSSSPAKTISFGGTVYAQGSIGGGRFLAFFS
ncbi:MAG: hypothetical protein U5N55_11725 [Cypionkella sp.]|nr:hypothetical protein [Cypionkella sp.]